MGKWNAVAENTFYGIKCKSKAGDKCSPFRACDKSSDLAQSPFSPSFPALEPLGVPPQALQESLRRGQGQGPSPSLAVHRPSMQLGALLSATRGGRADPPKSPFSVQKRECTPLPALESRQFYWQV